MDALNKHESVAGQEWTELFPSLVGAESSLDVTMQVLRRNGHGLLAVPDERQLAVASLALYSAQRRAARTLKWVLSLGWRLGLPLTGSHVHLKLAPGDPFVCFLQEQADTPGVPHFAVLSGNPNTQARRHCILLFNAAGQPVKVVKAGVDAPAMQLIAKEESFLGQAASKQPHLPRLCGGHESSTRRAFSIDFVPGDSPSAGDLDGVREVLTSWLHQKRTVRVAELPQWARLREAAGSSPAFAELQAQLAELPVRPVLFHGDFVPWNIKASTADKKWTVLDWERGEMEGPPGWDWFHFVLQSAILVQRASLENLATICEDLLRDPRLIGYLELCGMAPRRREWLLAYLIYCDKVLKPSEGRERTAQLLQAMASR